MLFEQVLSSNNLCEAWKRVKQNKGAAGVDGLTIEDYPVWIYQHWENISSWIATRLLLPVACQACGNT